MPTETSAGTFWRIWVLALLVKLFLSTITPLFADEMYYWVWSNHMSLSFFDHPPFIAWLIYLGHAFESWGSAVRWPLVIFGHFVPLIWYKILTRHTVAHSLTLWLALCFLSPVTGLGSMIATPDVPLLVFWSLSLYFFLECLQSPSAKNYVALGSSLGLGFCSKYHIVLFIPIALAYLFFERKWSRVSAKHILWLILCGLIFSSVVLIWNYQNDWASFRFQLSRGLGKPFEIGWVGDYISGQILLIFPTVLWAAYKASKMTSSRWLLYFGWGPILFFLFSSMKGRVELNWTTISVPSLITLALCSTQYDRWLKRTTILWAAASALIVSQLVFAWIPLEKFKLKSDEFHAYDDYIPYVDTYKPFYVGSYQMASALYYKTKTPVYKIMGLHRKDHFDYMPEAHPQDPVFYAVFTVWSDQPQYLLDEYSYEVLNGLLPNDMRLLKFTKK